MRDRHIMRSKLFVPGSRPEIFQKAMEGNADAISFDLEDAVHESQKGKARVAVSDFLARPDLQKAGKLVIVRVNELGHDAFELDLKATISPQLHILNIPKLESADDVVSAVKIIKKIEKENGIQNPVGILANIETPKGLRCASEIACADPRVMGLQIGFADLFGPLGVDRTEHTATQSVRFAVRLAAGEAGISAYDAAFLDVKDMDALEADARYSKQLGFAGKSCIHPAQIDTINNIFMPSDQDLKEAEKVIEAARRNEEKGAGVFMFNGRMIDKPVIRAAERILQLKHHQP